MAPTTFPVVVVVKVCALLAPLMSVMAQRERWLGVDLEDGNTYRIEGIKQPHIIVDGVCTRDNEEYYLSSRYSIIQQCGEVCDLNKDLREEAVAWSGALKNIDCDKLWVLSHEEEELFEWPPPSLPPCCLLNDYKMNDANVHLRWQFMLEREINITSTQSETDRWTIPLINEMVEEARNGLLHKRYNAAKGSAGDGMGKVLEGLKYLNVVGKHVLVIGSTSPWVEACALAQGAAHVTTLGRGCSPLLFVQTILLHKVHQYYFHLILFSSIKAELTPRTHICIYRI
jgi:hypothetical protein